MPKRARENATSWDKKLKANLKKQARADREAEAALEEDMLFAEHSAGFIETEVCS